jgi:hypothetical protein
MSLCAFSFVYMLDVCWEGVLFSVLLFSFFANVSGTHPPPAPTLTHTHSQDMLCEHFFVSLSCLHCLPCFSESDCVEHGE